MTYTALVRVPAAGLIGAASASRSLALGNAVLAVDPALGAVASQAWTNRLLRHRLLDALAAGEDAAAAVARIPEWDEDAELRQVAVLPLTGEPAACTGAETTAWSGHRILSDAVVAGNLLTGPEVLDAMAACLTGERTEESGDRTEESGDRTDGGVAAFARLLIRTLGAGEGAGGDRRGRQSAAIAIATTPQERRWPPELVIDLRVDDHEEPVAELTRLLELRLDDIAELRGDLSSRGE
jgi:uncharacterized Ntn-hydrolase superfamily protein